MTSRQVLEPEETVPHACTTTARILVNHLMADTSLPHVTQKQQDE